MRGDCMKISANTIQKMNGLSEENRGIIISLVEQLAMTPLDVLSKLREQGLKEPMEMDEMNAFISETREKMLVVLDTNIIASALKTPD